jgi:formate dehydrogenase gamma subunit
LTRRDCDFSHFLIKKLITDMVDQFFRSAVMPRIFLVALGRVIFPLAAFGQSNSDCLMCHNERSTTMTKKGKTVSLFVDRAEFYASAHAELQCVSCHEGFSASDLPHAKKIGPVQCISCHSDEQFQKYSQSVHGMPREGKGLAAACSDCHSTHAIIKLSAAKPADLQRFIFETCERCHARVEEKYMSSSHGQAVKGGVRGAPLCIDCHGEHGVLAQTNDSSGTSKKNQAATCLKCHADNPDVRAKVGPSAGFIKSYENSVHSRAVQSGNDMAAACSDCHGGHDMRKGSDPASHVAKRNIASTCGQCHPDVLEQYIGSIHGKALASGIAASATCTDCHGEHNILSSKDAASPVAPANVSTRVCSPCHESVKLASKYGLASDRFKTFADSYHGLADKAGSVEVANCASCHGIHDIKPSIDSTSRISKQNLAKTCGTCHPGANENFTKGSVHIIAASGNDRVLYLVATTYLVLIGMTVGGMFFHNLTDFIRKSRRQLMERRGAIPFHHVASRRLYLRMSLNERVQHALLLISFFLLVLTGFALRFPDAWWVAAIRNISPLMFGIRGILHRIAAVILVLAGLYHVYYILLVPRGKQLIRDLLPGREDISDALAVMKYNVGLAKTKPMLGRFSYVEKAEYWALIWGTVVMSVTGMILWFDNTFLNLLTKLWWDVARTVHYYEAWLATLSIIVWHLYFVIFNPDSYPINLAFWKGTLTEEEMAQEHPRELEEIKRRENAHQENEKS